MSVTSPDNESKAVRDEFINHPQGSAARLVMTALTAPLYGVLFNNCTTYTPNRRVSGKNNK